ncbi:hypothetical protein F4803DRAFT_548591 [Xylaria telfairii]|nr:hypothetical protein F4803DRAFT_548591 [Xylaria telfairii]
MAADIFTLWGCAHGYGKHVANLTQDQAITAFKSFYLGQIVYKVSLNFTKASILLLYLRLFNHVKWLRWTCYVLLAIVGSYSIASTVVTIFQCNPVVAAFNKYITDAKCINLHLFWRTTAIFAIVTDFFILLIPIRMIYGLQMPLLRRLGLIFLFVLGLFVTIASGFRTEALTIRADSIDPQYYVETTMWSLIEMNLAMICACLPALRCLATRLLFPKVKSAYCDAKSKLGLGKPDGSCQQASDTEQKEWNQMVSQNDAEMTSTVCGGDVSPEEILSIEEGGGHKMRILKTMDYTLEYSKSEEKHSCNNSHLQGHQALDRIH